MTGQPPTLFDGEVARERGTLIRRVQALVAPVAARTDAIVDDPDLLEVADAIYDAFAAPDAAGGLSRARLVEACAGVCDEATFDSRFELFCRMGMLLPRFGKQYQQRYVFNLNSAAGIMVVQRLGERGGVDELLTLLDRTRSDLKAGRATSAQVHATLRSARRMAAVAADYLLRLVSGSTIGEMISERRHHEHPSLLAEVRDLCAQVSSEFPGLDGGAYLLVVEAQRYVGAREEFLGRLLDEGAQAKDFSLLDPEEYLAAARTAAPTALAEALAGVIFDPPSPWADPACVVAALNDFRPSPHRVRPPLPAGDSPADDPMLRVLERAEQARDRRARRAELMLGERSYADLTDRLRAAGWPAAAGMLVDVLHAAADPATPYTAEMSEALLVEPGGPVTYMTPVSLHRTPTWCGNGPPGVPVVLEEANGFPVGEEVEPVE
jgi:hypothetical protein